MASFHDPFYRVKTVDDSNYLRINIKNFLYLPDRPQIFYETIRELIKIKDILLAADKTSSLQQIGGRTFYGMALRWLKGDEPINTGVAVSQISSYEDINEAIASSFNSFVIWFRDNHLNTYAEYNQIRASLGISKSLIYQELEDDVSKLKIEFDKDLLKSQEDLSTSVNTQKSAIKEEIAQLQSVNLQQLRDEKITALSEIKQAKALADWYKYYRKQVNLYEIRLRGKRWRPINIGRSFNQLKGAVISFEKDLSDQQKKRFTHIIAKSSRLLFEILKIFLQIIFRATKECKEYLTLKVRSYQFQRGAWFSLLTLILLIQGSISILVLSKGSIEIASLQPHMKSITSFFTSEYVVAKVGAFIGFVLMPSLGYAFANKNYRIYSNLMEQYRHRATVAKTLQGILLEIGDKDNMAEVRQSLTAVAAVAMFEHKSIGHLSKHDGDATPMGEIIQAILKKP